MSPKIHVKILTLRVMVLGGLCLGEMIRSQDLFISGISDLLKEALRSSFAPDAIPGLSKKAPSIF
jgi:hypothetical protein